MRRISMTFPGNDCVYGTCTIKGCAGKRGMQGHGVKSERWLYSVVNPEKTFAMSIEISSNVYPESIPNSHWGMAWGGGPPPPTNISALVLHQRVEEAGHPGCHAFGSDPYIRCVAVDATSLTASSDFWKLNGTATYLQREVFWEGLENWLKRSLVRELRATDKE